MDAEPNPPTERGPDEWQRIVELIEIAEQAISTMLTLLRKPK